MKPTICFVTGGSGFVGTNLIPLLVQQGVEVRALARTEDASRKVETLGAKAVRGDLNDMRALQQGCRGADTVYHLAASVDFYAPASELRKLHVVATQQLLKAAQEAAVQRFVFLGAASVVMTGQPVQGVDESFRSPKVHDGYSQTKLAAEQAVLAANSATFRTVSLRPPLIWGKGDPNTLPAIVAAARAKHLPFIGGGTHSIVTCHVRSVTSALWQVATRMENASITGRAYFINDAKPIQFKQFVTRYAATQGVDAGNQSIPLPVARVAASLMVFVWRTFRLKGHPPIHPGMILTLGLPFLTIDEAARKTWDYEPVISHEAGFREMTALPNGSGTTHPAATTSPRLANA